MTPRLHSGRQVAAQPRLERRQAGSQRIDVGDAEGAEIGQASPLHVDPVRSGHAQQVRLADHDRAAGREGPAARRAGRLERVAARPGGRRIRVPDAGDDRVDARARVLPADQRQAVPDVDAEGRGRRVGRRRLDGRAAGLRPGAVDEGRLALDAVEALEDREIRDLVRGRRGVGEAARPDGAEDVAAGRRHRVREGRTDDGVDVGQVGRVGREGHDDRAARRRPRRGARDGARRRRRRRRRRRPSQATSSRRSAAAVRQGPPANRRGCAARPRLPGRSGGSRPLRFSRSHQTSSVITGYTARSGPVHHGIGSSARARARVAHDDAGSRELKRRDAGSGIAAQRAGGEGQRTRTTANGFWSGW